jgi:hypothetical protein
LQLSANLWHLPRNRELQPITSPPGSEAVIIIEPQLNKELLTTFRPGQWLYHAPKHCECWAATPAAAPLGPLKTMGTLTNPADILK